MRKIMISIALVALMLTGCSQKEGKTTAVENIATDTVATIGDASADATTEEVVEEPAPEKETLEAEATTEAVPATTEIGGGKKKAEETTEEKKPNTTESTKPSANHSNSVNSGSASSGQSTTPKPSNNGSNSGGNSGNSGSGNSGSSNSAPSPKPSIPATTEAPAAPATTEAPKPSNTEAPTTQHQHVYDQVVVDTPEQSVYHPEEGYYVPAVQCNTCYQVFTSYDDFKAHKISNGGWCDCSGSGSTHVWIKTKDEYTEVIPAETHRECKCGARE